MIGLYLPFMSNYANPNGCSIHNNNKVMVKKWVEANPGLCFFYPVYEGLDYGDYLDHPRIIQFEIERDPFMDQYRWASYVQSEIIERFFSEDEDGLFVDFIFNPKFRAAPYLELLFNNPNGESLPIFNLAYFVTSRKDAYYRNVNEAFDRSMYLAMTSGYTSFETDVVFKKMLREARKYLSISQIKEIDKEKRLPNAGSIPVKRVQAEAEKNERPKAPLTIHYAGRITHSMNADDTFDTFDSLFCYGRDIRIAVTSQGQLGQYGRNRFKEMEERGIEVELHPACPQEKFWEIAGRCHIKIAASHHGEFFNATAEQIVAGVVPILRKSEFQKPLWKDYPFCYNRRDELEATIRFVIENYWEDEVQEPVRKLREKVIDRYGFTQNAERLWNAIDEKVQDATVKIAEAGATKELLASALLSLGKDEVTFQELRDEVKSLSDTSMDIGTWSLIGKTTRMTYHRAMGYFGYEGIYDHDMNLTYKKMREVDLEAMIPEEDEDEEE